MRLERPNERELEGVAITGVRVVHRRDSARDIINRANRKLCAFTVIKRNYLAAARLQSKNERSRTTEGKICKALRVC
jgi:hypothetical protein